MSRTDPPMTLERFAEGLNRHWDRSTKHSEHIKMVIAAMGMSGEAGECLEHFKKHIRDGKPVEGNRELAYELGDVIHYWCRCVRATGFSIEDILSMHVEKVRERDKRKAEEAAHEARAAVQAALEPEDCSRERGPLETNGGW